MNFKSGSALFFRFWREHSPIIMQLNVFIYSNSFLIDGFTLFAVGAIGVVVPPRAVLVRSQKLYQLIFRLRSVGCYHLRA